MRVSLRCFNRVTKKIDFLGEFENVDLVKEVVDHTHKIFSDIYIVVDRLPEEEYANVAYIEYVQPKQLPASA